MRADSPQRCHPGAMESTGSKSQVPDRDGFSIRGMQTPASPSALRSCTPRADLVRVPPV